MQHIIIYNDPQFYSAFPSVITGPDNELLCAFRRAPDRRSLWGAPGHTHTDTNSYLVLVRSSDGGNTWTKTPETIFAHPMGGSQDPCMVRLSDGSIVCTSYGWAQVPSEGHSRMTDVLGHPPFYFLGGYVLRSSDNGKSWDGPFIPPTLPNDTSRNALGDPCPTFNRGSMLQMPDGSLLWAVVKVERAAPRKSSVHLVRSEDRAQTWDYVCPVASDQTVTFNETSLIRTRGGDIIAFMRTDGFDGKCAIARSTDGGKSFQPWEDGQVFGHPFHALQLKDGRILVVYGHRRAPFGIRAKVLNQEGTNFATAPEIILRDDGGNSDLGYPWAVELPDGRVLVAYYMNIGDGTRHIAATILSLK